MTRERLKGEDQTLKSQESERKRSVFGYRVGVGWKPHQSRAGQKVEMTDAMKGWAAGVQRISQIKDGMSELWELWDLMV